MGDFELLRTEILLFLKTKDGPKNITASISDYLESIRYTDKLEDQVDELEITLNNHSGIWTNAWFPKQGDQLKAIFKNTFGSLFCGTFNIDTLEASAPPSIFKIKALAVPFGSEMRRTKKNKAWEDVYLVDIASAICADGGVRLKYETKKNPYYKRQDQKRESNTEFLQRLCKEASLAMKITATDLHIFSRDEKEKLPAIRIIRLTPYPSQAAGAIINYNFQTQLSDSAKKCKVSYYDPKTGEKNEAEAEDKNANQKAQNIRLTKRAKNKAEAKRLAEAELKKRNQKGKSGTLRLIGDVSLFAGQNVELAGFGAFNGKYTIEESSHQLTNNGYTTQIRVTNTEPEKKKKK